MHRYLIDYRKGISNGYHGKKRENIQLFGHKKDHRNDGLADCRQMHKITNEPFSEHLLYFFHK